MRALGFGLLVTLLLMGCGASEPPPPPPICASDATVDGGSSADCGSGCDVLAPGGDVVGDAGSDGTGPTDAGPANGSEKWKAAFDAVFAQDHVVELKLDFQGTGWTELLTIWRDEQKKDYFPAKLQLDGYSHPNVGVRLKGLSSLLTPQDGSIDPTGKYPLKIDFNRFGGERFKGLDKLSLSNLSSDRSFMHEQLASRVYAAMGVPAPRTAYAKVTIDGVYIGVYILVQPLDERFLKEHYGTADWADDGNLYKCVHNGKGVCNLAWHGGTAAEYQLTETCQPSYDACGLVLKTHEDEPAWNHYRDLLHLLDVLNHAPKDVFEAELERVLDVEGVLRYLAATFVLSSYDSYLGKSNNFYLYHRVTDGRFTVLPWDMDGAYTGHGCTDRGDPTCGNAGNAPLIGRIFAVPKWKARFGELVDEALAGPFTAAQHKTWIQELDALVGPLVAGDPNYPEPVSTYQALTTLTPVPGQPEGLLAFVGKRAADLAGKK